MKVFVTFCFCCLSLQSSGQKNTTVETYTYKTDKRTVYGMDLTVPGPFELYINDIVDGINFQIPSTIEDETSISYVNEVLEQYKIGSFK